MLPWLLPCGLVLALTGIGWGADPNLRPAIDDPLAPLLDYRPPAASVVTDRDGREIGQFYVQRRRPVRPEEVPPHVASAFVASEDGRFLEHGGLDFGAILRALWTNVRAGRIAQGASTITQQLVKNVVLTPERTWQRKLQEMWLALEVERQLSKQEILLAYLNHIYLGNGSYGIGDAARSYFGKEVSALDLSEAALLAGLPQRPSAYSPVHHPEAAEARRRYVLDRMLARELVTAQEHREALEHPPRVLSGRPRSAPEEMDWFVEQVRRELIAWLGPQRVYRGGLRIETTVDVALQRRAQQALRGGLEALDRRRGWRGPLRRVAPEDFDERVTAIGNENGAAVPGAGPEPPNGWIGLVLEAATEAGGREVARVALGPQHGVRAEVDPAEWGLPRAPPGTEPRILRVGDVARFALASPGEPGLMRPVQQPEVEGALLALDVASDGVLAMVGGYDFERSEFNRAVQARRQPGSAFKPLVYAAAIEAGYSQASFVLDSPNLFWDPVSRSVWRPRNYGERFLGWLTLRRALARSVNNATIHLTRRIGVEHVVDVARRLGVRSELRPNLSLALGTSDVSLAELTGAYAALAAGGRRVQPRLVRRVLDRDGRVLLEDLPLDSSHATEAGESETGAVSPQVARVVTDLLQGAVSEPGATGARARELGRAVAGKTGTTNGNRDAWFVGFSPDVAAGVWVGFDRPRSLGPLETGGRAALPIWVDFMGEALESRRERDFPLPEGVALVRVDSRSGRQSAGPGASWQAFLPGTEPARALAPRHNQHAARRALLREAF